ncbi:MAG: type VI secretion system tube protein Hcp, partial [Gemmatimonadota bacterium]|nr:type VI secretion system tube protein Hcp [Gemmatimonadota bacterium]
SLESFSWGVTQVGNVAAGAGRGTGKVDPGDFNIIKSIDKASPSLFAACAAGAHTPLMTVVLRKAGGTQLEYLKYKFSDVMVSSYQTQGSPQGDALPSEQVSFTYGKIEISYTPQDAKGGAAGAVGAGWDFQKNVKV